MSKREVQQCFAALQPLISDLGRAIKTAPLPENEIAGLAVMCTAAMLGFTCGALKVDPDEGYQHVLDVVGAAFREHHRRN